MPAANLLDDGVSLYDRERVEDVEFQHPYKNLVDRAIKSHSDGLPSRDEFNNHPDNLKKKGPFEFMLPAGLDPREPMKGLAKACIDIMEGYGLGAVASVDTAKASRFDRATDMAIAKLKGYRDMNMLGFMFIVMRHEDSANPIIEGLLASMVEHGLVEDISEQPSEGGQTEDERLSNIRRLFKVAEELEVPTMSLVTVEPYESRPVFEEEPIASDPDLGPGMSSLG